jgi:hypothetical protein
VKYRIGSLRGEGDLVWLLMRMKVRREFRLSNTTGLHDRVRVRQYGHGGIGALSDRACYLFTLFGSCCTRYPESGDGCKSCKGAGTTPDGFKLRNISSSVYGFSSPSFPATTSIVE